MAVSKAQSARHQNHFDFKLQTPPEDDWTNSCCDYQSDVFKEQLSCEVMSQMDDNLDYQNIRDVDLANEDGIFNPSFSPTPSSDLHLSQFRAKSYLLNKEQNANLQRNKNFQAHYKGSDNGKFGKNV